MRWAQLQSHGMSPCCSEAKHDVDVLIWKSQMLLGHKAAKVPQLSHVLRIVGQSSTGDMWGPASTAPFNSCIDVFGASCRCTWQVAERPPRVL